MKTLHNLFNYITLFSYGVFLGFLFTTIVNIGLQYPTIEPSNWFKVIAYLSAIITAHQVYIKTCKYLIQ